MDEVITTSDYLIDKLLKENIHHVFGVPGDYALGFYSDLEKSQLKVINTSDEQGAGFAADAYARINGLGAVCITYCVGGLNITNSTAQAFAEKSPVVVISGAPGIEEQKKKPLLHHKVRNFDSQFKIFEEITADATILNDPKTACLEIDRVLDSAMRYKRPVYIELPRDMVAASVAPSQHKSTTTPAKSESNPEVMNEFMSDTVELINNSEQPVIIAGVEIHRFGLQDKLLKLLEQTRIPVVSTILGKSVVPETHPEYLGVYEGAMCRNDVRDHVENSDCLILLGVFMTDINLGGFTAHIDPSKVISVTSEKISIHYHTYEHIQLDDVLTTLIDSNIFKRDNELLPHPPPPQHPELTPEKKISVKYLFERLNVFLDDYIVVLADPGNASFGAMDMTIHKQTEFISPAYYNSLGFAVPASIGAQLADPNLRPLVLVGDGAFQMTGLELSSAVRFGLNPIIVVLNNRGYGTERPMIEGEFNDIPVWNYSKIPEILDSGQGFDVHTQGELESALKAAKENRDTFSILDVHLDPHDSSPSLQRLTEALKAKV